MKNIVLAIFMAATAPAWALTVTVTQPGTVKSAVQAAGSDLQTVTELTVSGPVNAADLFTLGNEATSLTTLDLSATTIAAYDGETLQGSKVYAADLIPNGAFAGTKLQTVVLPATGSLTIGDMAFAQSALTALPAMTNVTTLGNAAFSGCTSLTAIDYPAGVTATGDYLFAGCTALKTVNTGAASAVAPHAFDSCTALTDVTGSENLQNVGTAAFYGCSALHNFNFGNQLASVGAYAFAESGIEGADLQHSSRLATVGDFAFANCPALASIHFAGNSAPALGQGVFFDDKALTSIQLPEGITALPAYSFKGTDKLALDTIPDGIAVVDEYALKDNATSYIALPTSLTRLGDGAMENMTNLETIRATRVTAVPELGKDVWRGVDQKNVRLDVRPGLQSDFSNADQWCEFALNVTTEDDGITADGIGQTRIRARFVGSDLLLDTPGANMTLVDVYDTAGTLVAQSSPAADYAVVSTASASTPFFIVVVTLDNGTSTTLKLKR